MPRSSVAARRTCPTSSRRRAPTCRARARCNARRAWRALSAATLHSEAFSSLSLSLLAAGCSARHPRLR
eukprot:16047949-Heterocapsa_arctica.AAC.1